MIPGWMKIKPAAAYSDVSERTFRSWLKQGLIHSRLSTGLVLTHTTNIDSFLKKFEVDVNAAARIADAIEKELKL